MNHQQARSILGVASNATEEEITKAYRKMAMKHHPDRGGSEARFKELQEAMRVLATAESEPFTYKKAAEQEWTRTEEPSFKQGTRPPLDDLDEDTIGTMFGAKNRSNNRNFATGVKTETIVLTLQEAFKGCHRSVPIPNRHSLSGHPTSIHVPAGVYDGQVVETFVHSKEDKTVVQVRIASAFRVEWGHSDRINGGNIYNNLRIPVTDMILGGSVEVPMIDGGTVEITIPPGLAANSVLRIRDRGYWTFQGSNRRGDCLLTAVPIITTIKNMSHADRVRLEREIDEHYH